MATPTDDLAYLLDHGAQVPIFPSMQCCSVGKLFVFLIHEDEVELGTAAKQEQEAALALLRETPPRWFICLKQLEGVSSHSFSMMIHATQCPGCGTPTPPIKLRASPPAIRTILDGGYYCGTCKERLMGCECAPSACLWEIDEAGPIVHEGFQLKIDRIEDGPHLHGPITVKCPACLADPGEACDDSGGFHLQRRNRWRES